MHRKLPKLTSPLGGGGWVGGGPLSSGRQLLPPRPTPAGRFEKGRARGFSLIELLVVLLLIGIMAGVAGPAMGRFLDSLAFREQTAKVMATVRYARLKAITEGKLLIMTATEGDSAQGLTLSGAVNEVRPLELDEEATLEVEPLELVFSPEGYATPGILTLTSGERSEIILIDPLSGLPRLEEAEDE